MDFKSIDDLVGNLQKPFGVINRSSLSQFSVRYSGRPDPPNPLEKGEPEMEGE